MNVEQKASTEQPHKEGSLEKSQTEIDAQLAAELDAELLAAEMTKPPVESVSDILGNIIKQALEAHKRNGNPVAEWQDGKIVILPEENESKNR